MIQVISNETLVLVNNSLEKQPPAIFLLCSHSFYKINNCSFGINERSSDTKRKTEGWGCVSQTEDLKFITIYGTCMLIEISRLPTVRGSLKITGLLSYFIPLFRTPGDAACGQTVRGEHVWIDGVKNDPEQILQMKVEVDLSV